MQISATIRDDLAAELDREADRCQRSRSWLVSAIVSAYFRDLARRPTLPGAPSS